MRQLNDQQYSQFTPQERVSLIFTALEREDYLESSRLIDTCPKATRIMPDCFSMYNAYVMIGYLFFQKCVFHYNNIEFADRYLYVPMTEEKKDRRQKFIDITNKALEIHIGGLKGLYEGLKQFCIETGINSDDVLRILSVFGVPIEKCCPKIDYWLASDIAVDKKKAEQYKKFFLTIIQNVKYFQ